MVRPYSHDLRERVASAAASGRPIRKVAEIFGVSIASVAKWSQRFRQTGSAAAKPMGGKRPILLAGQRAWLLERIETEPHVPLRRLVAELAGRGIKVSYGAVWLFVRREGLSHKKKRATRRTGSAGRGAAARTLETSSGARRP